MSLEEKPTAKEVAAAFENSQPDPPPRPPSTLSEIHDNIYTQESNLREELGASKAAEKSALDEVRGTPPRPISVRLTSKKTKEFQTAHLM